MIDAMWMQERERGGKEGEREGGKEREGGGKEREGEMRERYDRCYLDAGEREL